MSPGLSRAISWGTAAAAVLAAALLMALGVEASWAGVIKTFGCHLPILLGAWAVAKRVAPDSPHRLLLAAYIYFSGFIGLGLVLGLVGLLTPAMALFTAAVLGTGMCWLGRTAWQANMQGEDRSKDTTATLAGAILIVLIVLVAWRSISAPTYDYDVLTYHLMFPARWIQDGAISIIPTWCGDPAPAYAPMASEVYYTWLFLPMGQDTLARCGQFPFWLLLLIAAQGLAGELRLGLTGRRCAAILVVLIPSVTAQAGTAMVDVALAAHLVAVACFCLRIVRRPPRPHGPEAGAAMSISAGDVMGLVLASGLLLGTKYIALAYLAAFLPLLVWVKWRSSAHRRSLLRRPPVLLAMLVAYWIGGFWYVRNAALTGNPVYPVEVRIGTTVLCDGAYGRAQMENSPFNVRRQNPADAFGRTVWQAWNAPGAAVPAADEATNRATVFRHWYLGPVGFMAGLFLLAAVVRIVCLFRVRPESSVAWASRPCTHRRDGGATGSMGFNPSQSVGGRAGELSELLFYLCVAAACAVFWYVLPFQQPRFAFGLMVLGVVGAAGAVRVQRRAGPILLTFVVVFCWPSIRGDLQAMFTSVPWPATDPRSRTFSSPQWQFLGPAWDWVDRELHDVTIAYVGNNVPYFLCGRRLENRILYVPARHPAQGRFDEYAASPAAVRLGAPNTSEPAVDRYVMDGNIWLENLRGLGVDYVLVSQMFPGLLLNMRHDSRGFPVEEQWLDKLSRTAWADGAGDDGAASPALAERRVFAGGAVRLYRLHLPSGEVPGLSLSRIVRDETDALARLQQDRTPRGRPIRDYPLARSVIERYGLAPINSAGHASREER